MGRRGQRAYAYLFHPVDRVLSEQAYERLRTIGEHTELGSGFKIAMRDLEIRGAGNLLGSDQSAISQPWATTSTCNSSPRPSLRRRVSHGPPPLQSLLMFPATPIFPTDYVAAEDARLEAYRRLAAATSEADVDDIGMEWADRYGPLPAPAVALLAVGRLRTASMARGIREITLSPVRTHGTASRRSG